MAKTESQTIAVGTKAPDFDLFSPLLNSKQCLTDLKGNHGTVIIFMCNHCPYVLHIISAINNLAAEYQSNGITFIGINSNDPMQYPEDAPDAMVEFAKQRQLTFPYLFDESQRIAKAYQAACTPDIYVFDNELSLFYHGQFDNSRPGLDIAITGDDLRLALDRLISNQSPPENQKPSLGCNIKWK